MHMNFVFSRELPPGKRVIITFECDTTSHALFLDLDLDALLDKILNNIDLFNSSLAFKLLLDRSLAKRRHCLGKACIFNTKKINLPLCANIWQAMPPEIKSLF